MGTNTNQTPPYRVAGQCYGEIHMIENCPLFARSIRQCESLRRSNPACVSCKGQLTRTVSMDIPATVYETINRDAVDHGETFESHVLNLLALAASGEYHLVRRSA